MSWHGWDAADPEVLARSEEFDAEPYPPTFEGFADIANAATEATIPIIRHVRHIAHKQYATTHNPKGHDWNRHDGGASDLTDDDAGGASPAVVAHLTQKRSNHASRPRRRAA